MREAKFPLAVFALTLAIFGWPSSSRGQVPLGSEFLVNGAAGIQNEVSAAMQPDGGFVVTWTDQGTNNGTIVGRRYDRDGIPVGTEFTVNTSTVARHSMVGASATGGFVVAWEHYPDGDGWGILARRFDADGSPIGSEFQVNTVTAEEQFRPSISVAPAGHFVVAWETFNAYPGPRTVHAQAFDAAGARVGAELQVSTGATRQYQPSVSMDPTGAFIVAWADKERLGIYARRYDPAAQPVAGEFRVNTNSAASEIGFPAIAQGAGGEFVVAWQRNYIGPPPPNPPQPDRSFVNLQRFDAAGARVGGEHQVPGDQAGGAKVAFHAGGRSTLVWASAASGAQGVFQRSFDPAGGPIGSPARVTAMSAGGPVLAAEDASRLVIAWVSPPFGTQVDVWARLHDRLDGAGMTADATATAGSDGNGVVEAGETFSAAPVWANLYSGAVAPFGGTAVTFSGPGTSTYAILDGSAAYDAIAGGATAACDDATPDCYQLSISAGARPAVHWDAALQEQLTPTSEHGGRTWSMHVGESFTDVPRSNGFYGFVETLLHRGVTAGCTGTSYCPTAPTSREQMAVFALVARDGGSVPQACPFASPMFDDVPYDSPFCPWIEELARRGVVAGCGPRLYCPTADVSREQMAVFVLRTLDASFVAPPCAPPNLFTDVPDTSPFCPWIEELAGRGVVTGCAPGLFCPESPVTREQMAVFIAVTFGLTLYGP